MKKKSATRSKKPSSGKKPTQPFNIIKYIIAGILASLVILFALTFFNQFKQPFCANSISCIKDLSGKLETGETEGIFMGKSVQIPKSIAASKPVKTTEDISAVLGDNTSLKQIYVDLSTQHLYAFEDNKLVYDFTVSTGKWNRTPIGKFKIWSKLKYTKMSGGNPAIGTYYYLPNVPDVMFYSNDEVGRGEGYSIHGAYWHNNFGHPMSHGCINMKLDDAGILFNWANPSSNDGNITYATNEDLGTEVIVYGEAPQD